MNGQSCLRLHWQLRFPRRFDAHHQPVPQLDSAGEAVGATAFPTTDLMNHEWAEP